MADEALCSISPMTIANDRYAPANRTYSAISKALIRYKLLNIKRVYKGGTQKYKSKVALIGYRQLTN